jgi:hypothetical protein
MAPQSQPEPASPPASRLRRLAWFVALYVGGLVAITALTTLLRVLIPR